MLARLDGPLAIGIVTCLVAGAALLLTRSRGAFVALCAALVAFVWSLRRTSLITSQAIVKTATVFSLGLFLGIVGLAGGQTLGRFADADLANRLVYYRTTWEAIRDRPLLGTGYGTYADAFRAYNHAGTGTYFLDKAHSTYLQMIMELGWPAAAALYAGLGLLVFRCLQGRSAVYPAVLAACSVLVGSTCPGRLQPRDAGGCRHLRFAPRRRVRASCPRQAGPRADVTSSPAGFPPGSRYLRFKVIPSGAL